MESMFIFLIFIIFDKITFMVCLSKYIKADRRLNYVLWRLLNDLSNILVAALVIYYFSP